MQKRSAHPNWIQTEDMTVQNLNAITTKIDQARARQAAARVKMQSAMLGGTPRHTANRTSAATRCAITAAQRIADQGGCATACQVAHVAAFNLAMHGSTEHDAIEQGEQTGQRFMAIH